MSGAPSDTSTLCLTPKPPPVPAVGTPHFLLSLRGAATTSPTIEKSETPRRTAGRTPTALNWKNVKSPCTPTLDTFFDFGKSAIKGTTSKTEKRKSDQSPEADRVVKTPKIPDSLLLSPETELDASDPSADNLNLSLENPLSSTIIHTDETEDPTMADSSILLKLEEMSAGFNAGLTSMKKELGDLITETADKQDAKFELFKGEVKLEIAKVKSSLEVRYETLNDEMTNLKAKVSNFSPPDQEQLASMIQAAVASKVEELHAPLVRDACQDITQKFDDRVEQIDRDSRKKNVIISGLNMEAGTNVKGAVESFLANSLGINTSTLSARSIPIKGGKPLLKVELDSVDTKVAIFQAKKTHKLEKVYINSDLTREEGRIAKAIRSSAKALKLKNHKVKISGQSLEVDDLKFIWNKKLNSLVKLGGGPLVTLEYIFGSTSPRPNVSSGQQDLRPNFHQPGGPGL